eukprot:75905_1
MTTRQNDEKTELSPLHQFTPQNLCNHIETWLLHDVNYHTNLSETKDVFAERELNGLAISTRPMVNTTLMIQNDLKPFMTPQTLNIILTYCRQWKQREPSDFQSKSAEEIADVLFHYPLRKLLKRITDERIDGKHLIQSIYDKEDIIANETGWNADEVYQIHTILFRHYTFTKAQFTSNMDHLLHRKYALSKVIADEITELMEQHNVEVIHCKIKNASHIDEFSDSVMNMVDELTHVRDENELIMQIYKVVAECFILGEHHKWSDTGDANDHDDDGNKRILQLQHWICNHCGNPNVNTCIKSKFTTHVAVCTLCGMDQIRQIILKLRKHDSYIMVNHMDTKQYQIPNQSEDSDINRLIVQVRELDAQYGSFDLSCPARNHNMACGSILRLANRLIMYKRWLHTIYREKGTDDIRETIKVDIDKHINEHTFKQTFMRSVKEMGVITANEMQSITDFMQQNANPTVLNANVFLNNNVQNMKTFSQMIQTHIYMAALSERFCKKLYKSISKELKQIQFITGIQDIMDIYGASTIQSDKQYISQATMKRIFIEKAQFIRNQTQLLTDMFNRNAGNITNIAMFTKIRPLAFGKLIRTHTGIDTATGVGLYRSIKKPLTQLAQAKEFGQFLSDFDKIKSDYDHICQIHIRGGNKESIKNVFRFFEVVTHLSEDPHKCRFVKRKKNRLDDLNADNKEQKEFQNEEDKDIWSLNQHYVQSQLDIIHCHLAHSDIQRALQRFSQKQNLMGHGRRKSNFSDTELSGSDTSNYGFGICHEHQHLNPVYDSVHDELLRNRLHHGRVRARLNVKQFQNALVTTIKKHYDVVDMKERDLKCKYYQKQYNILRNECIGLRHLFAISVYADFTSFCTIFRQTYRRINNEPREKVVRRHRELYYYAKSLYEAIEFFGECMSPSMKVFHGLDRIVFFSKFTTFFCQPLSTTTALNVANIFAKGIGIVLALKAATQHLTEKHQQAKYLSISWLSSFPNEEEYLFYGQHVVFEICDIYKVEQRQMKGHAFDLLLLNGFQKIISNEYITWKERNPKFKTLAKLIQDHHHNTGYISTFGRELFDYFCEHQKEIRVKDFVQLPSCLRDALFTDPNDKIRISFLRITKLFAKIHKIELNELDIDHMTGSADDYIQSVFHYTQSMNKSRTHLESIIFKSKRQSDGKQNSTLQNKTHNKHFHEINSKYHWVVHYELSAENTHNLSFDRKESKDLTLNVTHSEMLYSPNSNQLPEYFMQVTSVEEDVFHLKVLADVDSAPRKLYIKDMDRLIYISPCFIPIIRTKTGESSWVIDIGIPCENESYRFALYDSSQAMTPIPNSTALGLTVLKDEKQMPPENDQYEPNCIDMNTVFQVQDKPNKQINIYWTIPPKSFGNISYQIIKDNVTPNHTDRILSLPYAIPVARRGSFKSFRVITVTEIEDLVYVSKMSKPITIEYGDESSEYEPVRSTIVNSTILPSISESNSSNQYTKSKKTKHKTDTINDNDSENNHSREKTQTESLEPEGRSPIEGMQCEIYSKSQKQWFDGYAEMKDKHGEFLIVRYIVNGSIKKKPIRINSKHIRLSDYNRYLLSQSTIHARAATQNSVNMLRNRKQRDTTNTKSMQPALSSPLPYRLSRPYQYSSSEDLADQYEYTQMADGGMKRTSLSYGISPHSPVNEEQNANDTSTMRYNALCDDIKKRERMRNVILPSSLCLSTAQKSPQTDAYIQTEAQARKQRLKKLRKR